MLTSAQIAALREIEDHFKAPIVIIGATALGFYLDMSWRMTADLDLVIAVEMDQFPGGLDKRTGWMWHPHKQHEFVAPSGAKVDIVPAGVALLHNGAIEWPNGRVMTVAGLDLALEYAETKTVSGHHARVAPPKVVTVLKMASYLDRPYERRRDLADLAHLLDHYLADDDERRWQEDTPQLDFELVPAHALGVDVGKICAAMHRELVQHFVEVVSPERTEHAVMERLGPARWRSESEPLARRIETFRNAFSTSLGSS